MSSTQSTECGQTAGKKRKASVVDALEELHISDARVRNRAKKVRTHDDGLLILEGDDLLEDDKPDLEKINIPFGGPISLRKYAELIEEQEVDAEAEADGMDVDVYEDEDEDTTMTDAGDILEEPIVDDGVNQDRSTAHGQ